MNRVNWYKTLLSLITFYVLVFGLYLYQNNSNVLNFIDDMTQKYYFNGNIERIVVKKESHEESTYLYSKEEYWKKEEEAQHKENTWNKFVIFNCQGYSGSLNFLPAPHDGWIVFVTNLESKDQLKSCPNCLTFDMLENANSVLDEVQKKNGDLDKAILQQMAAVLYASSMKAEWIYVTNKPTPVPLNVWAPITTQQPTKGLVYRGPDNIFQPCEHFMDTFTWNGKGELKTQNQYTLRPLPDNSLYQVVDQCYKEGMPTNWQSRLDNEAPPSFVMPGIWAAADFSNIMVPKATFWTLLASMPVTSSSSSSYLSAIVQRMLWETQNTIGFYPGSPGMNKCPTCDIETSLSKIPFLALTDWSCKSEKDNMLVCLEEIAQMVLKENTEELKLVNTLISTWVYFMKLYQIPASERLTLNKQMLGQKDIGNHVYFTPAKSLHKETDKGNSLPPNVFRDVCKRGNASYKAYIPDSHPKLFEKVLLVVSFNSDRFLGIINQLEFLFGRHFKHILYCATGITAFENLYLKKSNINPVSFVDVDIGRGYYGHHCAVAAMEMNYDVEGYLYMSDDVMISMWNMHNHPFDMPWFQTDIRVVNLKSTFTRGHDFEKDWYPWNKPTGKPAITKVINHLKELKQDPLVGNRVTWFLKNLAEMASCDNCIAYMDADLYYIPAYMASDFVFFVPYFKGVFQELSIPTILSGITPQSDRNIYRLRGYYLVGDFKRNNFNLAWSHEELFIHPVKLSQVGVPKVRDFYCGVIHRSDKDLAELI